MLYDVSLKDFVRYERIEADTKEEAIRQAMYWWEERMPSIQVEEVSEND